MIIAPNSNAKLLTGVPIDSSYNHTVWFDSTAEQKAFFDGHVKSDVVTSTGQTFTFSLTGLTNQRVERNYISVNIPYALLLDINYVMFQNTMYDATKWFYGFVTNIEYVNTVTTNVYYEIDLIQTFLFDFTLQNVRVDREIVVDELPLNSDNIPPYVGKYSIKENLPFSNNVNTLVEKNPVINRTKSNVKDFFLYFSYTSTKGVIDQNYSITENTLNLTVNQIEPFNAATYFSDSRTLTASQIFIFDSRSIKQSDITEYITQYFKQIVNTIISEDVQGVINDIQMLPLYLFQQIRDPATLIWQIKNETTQLFSFTMPPHFKAKYSNSTYLNYTPKNQILYTSPYCLLCVYDYAHNSTDFLPELFSSTQMFFVNISFIAQKPCTFFVPQYYNYNVDNNYEYAFSIENNYQIPWVEDAYIRWQSQNQARINSIAQVNATLYSKATDANAIIGSTKIAGQTLNSLLSLGQGAGNIVATTGETIGNQLNIDASNYQREQSLIQEISVAQNTVPKVLGNPNISNALIESGYYGYTFIWKTLSAEEGKVADDYYSLYGYKLNVVKTPVLYDTSELDCRKCWNYFKTSQCRLTRTENGANLNAADEEAIQAIFDRGITFWRNRDDVVIGDYSQDNPVVVKIS